MEKIRLDATKQLASHREAIHRYIISIVRNTAVAEDLAQETLLRAHQNIATLEDPTKLTSWLYRIATNLCYDRFRRAVRSGDESEPGDLPDLADTGPGPDKLVEQQEMSTCVRQHLSVLSDSYRAVILLHDELGMTNPEIAEMLGLSLPAVKIRVHRAREKLRGELKKACSFSADDRGTLVCEPKPLIIKD